MIIQFINPTNSLRVGSCWSLQDKRETGKLEPYKDKARLSSSDIKLKAVELLSWILSPEDRTKDKYVNLI